MPKVRLIGADGEQVGIVTTDDAREMARDADLDLVEVAVGAKPPVARLLDYSKYKYEQEQKLKAARKHQTQVNVREIKLRPKIAIHDYNTKKGHVTRFLKHGDKVKVTIMFRGREQAHPERGRDLLYRLFEDLEGLATIESKPLQEGRNMSMLLGPSKEATKFAEADKKEGEPEKVEEETPAAPVNTHPQAMTPEQVEAAEKEAEEPEVEAAETPAEEAAEAPAEDAASEDGESEEAANAESDSSDTESSDSDDSSSSD